jgi:dTDP-4-dehydrorhamnose 3,5-epimerase
MKITETGIEGLLIIEPRVFGDHRGYFFESHNEQVFHAAGITNRFVQDNESFSSYGTLRGLHFQKGDSAQAKLVRVVQGSVLDVAVDLRPDSTTFGKHFTIELTAENKRMFLVPRGFAHGFAVISPTAIFQYKCDNLYDPKAEGGIAWNDPTLNIDWKLPADAVLLSEKDQKNPSFMDFKSQL